MESSSNSVNRNVMSYYLDTKSRGHITLRNQKRDVVCHSETEREVFRRGFTVTDPREVNRDHFELALTGRVCGGWWKEEIDKGVHDTLSRLRAHPVGHLRVGQGRKEPTSSRALFADVTGAEDRVEAFAQRRAKE
mmetsp:Transcript_30852/g.41774  ORF Transcript_30852/g.41774 Transcript_30852/m.41774 type:complete len:135 (+) Transcript_30852:19-423(+)|eukprot:CAMPEP_0185798624 /NCGR_PEP_ID=MMETSP1174-20130828/162248_1 /TAXON_ID=35687 /ORGANISM="Dictyocha speculum, Strain CCMP1381" /LENGTH=134 /DNA_ID=CAMNT_0028494133 /DNA_START=19 /DNA_END=423 /DNA_ORIENTATION=+